MDRVPWPTLPRDSGAVGISREQVIHPVWSVWANVYWLICSSASLTAQAPNILGNQHAYAGASLESRMTLPFLYLFQWQENVANTNESCKSTAGFKNIFTYCRGHLSALYQLSARTWFVPITVLVCSCFAQAIVELSLNICAISLIIHNQNWHCLRSS